MPGKPINVSSTPNNSKAGICVVDVTTTLSIESIIYPSKASCANVVFARFSYDIKQKTECFSASGHGFSISIIV